MNMRSYCICCTCVCAQHHWLQVYYLPDIVHGVEDLLSGVADIVFIRADLLENLQAQGLLTVSSFKVLAQVI